MDELLLLLRKSAECPWMFWDQHYNAAFSPPDASFDFARFQIDDAKQFLAGSDPMVKYLGRIRWIKQLDYNVLLAWETNIFDGQEVSREENDFLVQDFHDLILAPACAKMDLKVTMAAGAWQKRTNIDALT